MERKILLITPYLHKGSASERFEKQKLLSQDHEETRYRHNVVLTNATTIGKFLIQRKDAIMNRETKYDYGIL